MTSATSQSIGLYVSPFIITLILISALMHAGWNALVKINEDRLITMSILAGSTAIISLALIPFFPPPDPAAWPFIALTTFIHLGYMGFLILAYEHGDFGQVYPIARGTAPLLTTLAAFLLLGEKLSSSQIGAIALLTIGILSLSFRGGDNPTRHLKATLFALGTAFFIAGYTITDSMGARLSGNVHGFTAWLFLAHGLPLFVLTAYLRRGQLVSGIRKHWKVGFLSGSLSFGAYWIVLWAITLGAIAPVAALRETSVVFGALIATFVLREGLGPIRILASILVASGVILLTIS